MLYGKEIFRTESGAMRVYIDQVPRRSKYVIVTLVNSSRPWTDFAFGDGEGAFLLPPEGFQLVGDAMRIEVFDQDFMPLDEPVTLKFAPPPRRSHYPPHVITRPFVGAKQEVLALNATDMLKAFWWQATVYPGEIFIVEDIDECKGGHHGCESVADGGSCVNSDGGYNCKCLDGWVKYKEQCLLAENTRYSTFLAEQGAGVDGLGSTVRTFSILVRPKRKKYYSAWRVDEVTLFRNPECTVEKPWVDFRASESHFPSRIEYAIDGDLGTSFVSAESNATPWLYFEVEGSTECLEVVSC